MILISACSSKIDKSEHKVVMLANATIGAGLSKNEISDYKVDAALALTTKLSGRYGFIEQGVRDSIAELYRNSGKKPILFDIAKEAKADELVFLRVDRFKNMLRVDLKMINVKDTSLKQSGEGFAFLNFRNAESEIAVYDPTLLAAMQRAFADALRDTNMFMQIGGKFAVKPSPTLVISGISFEETEGIRNWDIVDKKTVNSYSALESIFLAAKDCPDYVFYDIDTRDSIYSFFKLYLVENYSLPTMQEIDALRKFKVEYYVAGSYSQQLESADLTLSLFKITENNVIKINTVTDKLYEDKIEKFEAAYAEMTKKLLNIKKE